MRQMRGTLAMVVISLFAVGALTLGARELLAQDAATVCPYSPPNVLGECVSPEPVNVFGTPGGLSLLTYVL